MPQWYGVRNARTKVTSVSTPIDLGGDEWLDVVVEFLLLVACLIIMVATTFIFPEPLKAEARIFVWDDWREPLCGQAGGRGFGNYRILTVVVLVVFTALYVAFR